MRHKTFSAILGAVLGIALTVLGSWYINDCYKQRTEAPKRVREKLVTYHEALERMATDLSEAEAFFRKTVQTLQNPHLDRKAVEELSLDNSRITGKMVESCHAARRTGDEYVADRKELELIVDIPSPAGNLQIPYSICSLLQQNSVFTIEVDRLLSDRTFRQKYIFDFQRIAPVSQQFHNMATNIQVDESAALSSAQRNLSGIRGIWRCLKIW